MNNQPLPGELLHSVEYGHGEPVVLLHGFGASSFTWRHIIPTLSAHFRVISVDLKGFGDSPKARDDAYSIYDQARLVYQLLEKLDLRDVTLIGHSYGGGVALATAILLKDRGSPRLRRLVLVDAVAYEQDIPAFMKILRTPVLGRIGLYLLPPQFLVHSVLRLAHHPENGVPQESVVEYARPLQTPQGRYAAAKVAEQLIPADIGEFSRRYSEIDVPVLIIWGDADKLVPRDVGIKLSINIPGSTLHIIDQCGHVPQEEQPGRMIALLQDFLGF